MIDFHHVSKRYANDHVALRDINLHIPPGEMVFLTGHSGAGKTTLLKLILRLEKPSYGTLRLLDHQADKMNARQVCALRQSMGVVLQSPQLLPDQTVFDNVALPLIVNGMPKADIARRVRAALDKVSLLSKAQLYPISLSAGEQQRVAIARAVVRKPKIIIADEPTGNLDPALSAEIMQLLDAFHQAGVTVLVATHDIALIESLPHRILRLSQGRLINQETHSHAATT